MEPSKHSAFIWGCAFIGAISLKDVLARPQYELLTVLAWLAPALVGIAARWVVFGALSRPDDENERRLEESKLVSRFLLAIAGAACTAVLLHNFVL